VPVWYYLPESAKPDTQVLIVMHWVKRDAERYRNDWMPHAQTYGFVLVAPEFSRAEFPRDGDYSQGGVLDEQGQLRPREQTAFSFIEPIFDAVKAGAGNHSKKYQIYGHSAGAQFVHRFLFFVPEARASRGVSANAGWWTLPDMDVEFPFGLKGAPPIHGDALRTVLQRPLVVLLGTADTDPDDANLSRSKGAMEQGPHRFARGNFFFEYGQRQAAALGVALGWKLDTAPGIGHSDSGMSAFAVEWLFGKQAGRR
jgi:poly(3-hydroxybutyrate) depolymerase